VKAARPGRSPGAPDAAQMRHCLFAHPCFFAPLQKGIEKSEKNSVFFAVFFAFYACFLPFFYTFLRIRIRQKAPDQPT